MCVGCPNENLDIEKLNKRSKKYVSVRCMCVPSNNRTVWFRKSRGGEMPLGIYTRSICFDSGGEGERGGKCHMDRRTWAYTPPTYGCNGCVCERRT